MDESNYDADKNKNAKKYNEENIPPNQVITMQLMRRIEELEAQSNTVKPPTSPKKQKKKQ